MSDDRLITAIGRLERALSRIETNATAPARAPVVLPERSDGLDERHRRLRTHTQTAIEQLDRLIGASAAPGFGGGRHD